MKKIAYYLFCSALLFSPMAFGTVEIWSYLVMETLICASALFLYLSSEGKPFYRVPGLIPLLLLNGFILLQIIPLPAHFVKIVSPTAYEFYYNSIDLIEPVYWLPLSIYPRATLMEFLRISSYLLFYFIAVQFLSDRRFLKKTIALIAGYGAFIAAIAILEFIFNGLYKSLPDDKILWVRQLTQGGSPVGPYVNRNHFAGLMEMIFPPVLSLFLVYRPVITKMSFKTKLFDFFNQKQLHHHFFYGTAAILIATSIFLSISRAGIISLTLSMGVFALMLAFKTKQNKPGLLICLIMAIVLFLTGSRGWDAIFMRFENIRNQSGEIALQNDRFVIWKDSVKIINDFKILGTGTGTFEHIYPAYRTLPGHDIVEHAHNDYLEFLSTGGIIITSLMLIALFSIFYSAVHSYKKRREKFSIYLFIGCITSACAIFIHSLVDFNMQIGANGLYFFFILALAVSAANTRFRKGLPATYLDKSRTKVCFIGIASLFLCAGVFYINGGALMANYHFFDWRKTTLSADIPPKTLDRFLQKVQTAAAFDFLNPEYHQFAAHTAAMLEQDKTALAYYSKSLLRAPANSDNLLNTGSFLYRQGNIDLAEKLFLNSIARDKKNMAAYIKYAAMSFEQNRLDKGLEILKSAMSVNPQAADTCLSLMVLHDIHEDQMLRALPQRIEPHLAMGDFFDSLGENQKAETAYLRGLTYLPDERKINKRHFIHIYQFYLKKQLDEKALNIILQATEYFPEDHTLHHLAGNLYKKLGINYRADEEYRKAEILKSK